MLAIILATLLWNGFGGLSLDVFTKNTAPPGVVGGLLNSIVGSVIMTGIGLAIGAPLGILAGTYLAEYGANSRLAVGRALHQRHSAQRAVDRHRPVRLRDCWSCRSGISPRLRAASRSQCSARRSWSARPRTC